MTVKPRRLHKIKVSEISLVDRPANQEALVLLSKAMQSHPFLDDGSGKCKICGKPESDHMGKRQFTQGEREAAPTIPGTNSFPIETKADLKNAIQSIGRAKDPAAAKAHIIRQARKLGADDLIPDGWVTKLEAVVAEHYGIAPAEIEKSDLDDALNLAVALGSMFDKLSEPMVAPDTGSAGQEGTMAETAKLDLSKLDPEVKAHIEKLEGDLAKATAEAEKKTDEGEGEDAKGSEAKGDKGAEGGDVGKSVPAAVLKGMTPEAQAFFVKMASDLEQARTDVAKANSDTAAEVRKREVAEEVTKLEKFEHLALDPKVLAPTIHALRKLDPKAATAMDEALHAANAQAQLGKVTSEIGTGGSPTAGDSWSKIELAADAILKAEPKLSRPEAISKVAETAEGKRLVEAYRAEQAG